MQENEKQEYAFIREKIKDKPFQKRKLALHVLLAIVIAVVFGVVACATFTFLQPKMQKWMYPEEDPKITIPRDEEETETEEKKEDIITLLEDTRNTIEIAYGTTGGGN